MSSGRDAKKRERRAHRKERGVQKERRAEQNRERRASADRRNRSANLASGIAFVVTLLAGYASVHEYLPAYFRAMFPSHRTYGYRRQQNLGAILDVPLWIAALVVSIITWFVVDAIVNALKARRAGANASPLVAGDPPDRTARVASRATALDAATPDPESRSDRFALLDRAGEATASWRARLKQLFAGDGGYRGLPFSRDDLKQLLLDSAAPVERKIASALALRAVGDLDAERCIRASLDASDVPRVRVAFERLLDDRLDDDEIERALEGDPSL